MKKKELELFLEKVPNFNNPKWAFEQYKTPANIAADILFQAYSSHDITDKAVLDLGCGTGMFSCGAAVLHAAQVSGIDIDSDFITQAVSFAQEHQLQIKFLCTDICMFTKKADTVIMNPPFGAQKQNTHADRRFIEKATQLAPIVYSLHLIHTLDFIKTLVSALHKEYEVLQVYNFPLTAQFPFHTKIKEKISVACIRIT